MNFGFLYVEMNIPPRIRWTTAVTQNSKSTPAVSLISRNILYFFFVKIIFLQNLTTFETFRNLTNIYQLMKWSKIVPFSAFFRCCLNCMQWSLFFLIFAWQPSYIQSGQVFQGSLIIFLIFSKKRIGFLLFSDYVAF